MIRSKFTPPLLLSAVIVCSFAVATAQEPNPTSTGAPRAAVVTQSGDVFFYKVKVVQRDIDAINYLHRSASTNLQFIGTELLPGGKGEATVKSERGGITISAEFKGLTPANGFGQEYLTYVLWAITPDGRPNNLGEVLPAGTKNNITVTTALQSFGLIVTAEPYFSVSTPSDIIVLKNVIVNDQTNGVTEKITAHATLMPRGSYAEETNGSKTIPHPVTRDEKSPLELYEAYNAVRIAQAAGAEKYSADIYAKASLDLKNAADIDTGKKPDRKMEITFAREAVQTGRGRPHRAPCASRPMSASATPKWSPAIRPRIRLPRRQLRPSRSPSSRPSKSKLDAERSQLAAQQAQLAECRARTMLKQPPPKLSARAAQANKEVADANQPSAKSCALS